MAKTETATAPVQHAEPQAGKGGDIEVAKLPEMRAPKETPAEERRRSRRAGMPKRTSTFEETVQKFPNAQEVFQAHGCDIVYN